MQNKTAKHYRITTTHANQSMTNIGKHQQRSATISTTAKQLQGYLQNLFEVTLTTLGWFTAVGAFKDRAYASVRFLALPNAGRICSHGDTGPMTTVPAAMPAQWHDGPIDY